MHCGVGDFLPVWTVIVIKPVLVFTGGGTYHSGGGGVDSITDARPLNFHICDWVCVVRL